MTNQFSKSILGLSDTCETMIKVIGVTEKKKLIQLEEAHLYV